MAEPEEFEFRIIAGSLKGRRIFAPDLGITRPPLSRLRKAIFDYLAPYLQEATYLDLFSGTGSYLFEAVSRGTAVATGIELNDELADAINTQAQKFGVDERLHCRCEDVFGSIPILAQEQRQYEIIMVAPPQYKGFINRTLDLLSTHSLLAPQGQILCQHDSSETGKIKFAPWHMKQRRKYGNTTFTILGHKEDQASD